MTWKTKRGSTAKPIRATLSDEDGVVALQGAAVRFIMRQVDGDKVVVGEAEIEDAARGMVLYRWKPEDVDTIGVFRAEWEVRFAAGTELEAEDTFPSGEPDEYIDVVIIPDLG